MSDRNTLIAAVIRVIKAAIPTLTDAQVKRRNHGGARPPLPYLMVSVPVHDITIGFDEVLREEDGSGGAQTRVTGMRRSTIQITGFGVETSGWIGCLKTELKPSRVAFDKAVEEGLTFVPIGGDRDLPSERADQIEEKFIQDFDVTYRIMSEPQAAIEVLEVSTELESCAPDGATFTDTIDVTG